jgi:hypothetical protein
MGSIIIFSNIAFSVCSTYNAYGFIIFLSLQYSDLPLGSYEGKMSKDIPRIHHVTAGTSNPQRKMDFHIRIFELLVELTVNKMTLDQNSNVLKLGAQ